MIFQDQTRTLFETNQINLDKDFVVSESFNSKNNVQTLSNENYIGF